MFYGRWLMRLNFGVFMLPAHMNPACELQIHIFVVQIALQLVVWWCTITEYANLWLEVAWEDGRGQSGIAHSGFRRSRSMDARDSAF